MDCFRHCEERSDVAIIAMTGRGAMTRWGRDDGVGAQ
jgi:hypothetical protein